MESCKEVEIDETKAYDLNLDNGPDVSEFNFHDLKISWYSIVSINY